MNRPSHWIIALFAIIGPALWIWGLTEGFGDAHEAASPAPRRARLMAPPGTQQLAPFEAPLSGRVTDERGQPIYGASIRVIGGMRADTRSSGSFEVMVNLGDPHRRIEVTAAGYRRAVERCAPCDLQSFVVALAPAAPWEPQAADPAAGKRPALVGEGYLRTDRGPLAGAVVTVLETGDSALTDDTGCFRVPLGAPSVSFAAWHPSGRAGALEAIKPAQSEGLVSLGVTSLGNEVQVSGSVRLPDGAPAAGAAVVLRHRGLVRRALADSSGAFSVAGLVAAEYELEVLPCAGALGSKQTLQVVSSGTLQSELKLVAEKQHRVRVVDAARAPHARSFVVAVDGALRRAWAQADAEGYAVLRGLGADGLSVAEARSSDLTVLKLLEVVAEGETTTVIAGK